MKIAHVYIGNSIKHPIIKTYIDFSAEIGVTELELIDSKQEGSRVARVFDVLKKLVNSRSTIYQSHDIVSCILVKIFKWNSVHVYDMHEIYSSYFKNSIIRKLFFYIEKLLLKSTQFVLIPNEERAQLFFKDRDRTIKYEVVENLLNDKELSTEDLNFNSVPKTFKFNERELRCFYAGTFTEVRALSEICLAIELLIGIGYKIVLDLYGAKTDCVNKVIKSHSFVNYCGSVSRAELLSKYIHYDFSFAFYKPTNLNNIYCAPTKIFEHEYYMLKTVVGPSGYLLRLVDEGVINNVVVSLGYEPKEIAHAITRVLDSDQGAV